jgi:hypothetical protein
MVESGTVAEVSKVSILLTTVFTVVGIGLLYLYIAISEVTNVTKVLWASGLSLGIAFSCLIIWTLTRDFVKQREPQHKVSP